MNKPNAVIRRVRSRGFTMIEVLVALALTALMIGGVATMINSSLEDTRGQQTALYQQLVGVAAKQYIQTNVTDLVSKASTTPVAVNFAKLQTSNLLPANTSSTNPYGQTPCLLVYGDGTGALTGLLVTEGGTTIPDPELGYIAANSGQGGGSIPATNNGPGAAIGAFGEWTQSPAAQGGAKCTATTTGTGHLASRVYYYSKTQTADFLYRVQVPGDPDANTMHTPIVLAQQQIDYQSCATSAPGSIAADKDGNVVTCQQDGLGNLVWEPQASFHWRGTVPTEQLLGSVILPHAGDVAMTMLTNRAYTFNGDTSAWQALAVNESGFLNLGNAHNVGDDCPTTPAGNTAVTTDAQGRVLSCQNGKLQNQSEIVGTQVDNECVLLMAQANASDYGSFSSPHCYSVSTGFDTPTNTHYYTYSNTIKLDKSGVISMAAWEHMNDATYGTTYTSGAEIAQYIYVIDSNGNKVAQSQSQSPILVNDSMGINNSLSFPAVPGTYTVQVTSSYAHFEPPGTGTNPLPMPWYSNYEGGSGVVINTPVAAGWTISTYY